MTSSKDEWDSSWGSSTKDQLIVVTPLVSPAAPMSSFSDAPSVMSSSAANPPPPNHSASNITPSVTVQPPLNSPAQAVPLVQAPVPPTPKDSTSSPPMASTNPAPASNMTISRTAPSPPSHSVSNMSVGMSVSVPPELLCYSAPAPGSVSPEEWESTFGPRRKWRKGICDCFEIFFCSPLCLMSCCGCTRTILLGQIMERMGLDWIGSYDPRTAHNPCRIVTIVWVCYTVLCCLVIGILGWPFITLWLIVVGMRLRYEVRKRFQIQPEYCVSCNGGMEDCLCTSCCSCCSAIQMARQTHDEDRYPYNFSSNTGLPVYAPVIFEQPPPGRRSQPTAGAPLKDSIGRRG